MRHLIALFVLSAAASACTGNECAYDELEPQAPVTGIDCPSGDLCYLGQCFRGCNPGGERLEPCGTNDDCKNASRPNCVFADAIAGSFCSTCDEGESCVLGLNICQAVAEIADPPEPDNMQSNVPLPQDGGQIDATSFEDAGTGEPMFENVTYHGSIELSQLRVYENGGTRASAVRANFCDIAGTATKTDDVVLASRQTCELHMVTPYGGPVVAADLGRVSYVSDVETPNALLVEEIIGTFDSNLARYTFMPSPLPGTLFTASVPPQSSYQYAILDVSGAPVGSWPESSDEQKFLVPFAFELEPATEMMMLDAPVEMSISAPLDLEFRWVLPPAEVRENEVQGESIAVEIGFERAVCTNTGSDPRYYIRCTQREADILGDPVIVVPADLMNELMFNIDAQAGQTLTLRIGRTQARVFSFGDSMTRLFGEVVSYFGDEATSRIQFVP